MAADESSQVRNVGLMLQSFGMIDYSIFLIMLIASTLIGVYFGFFQQRKDAGNAQDYLVGGRNMKMVPVAISLVASYISGISLLGTPTEMYIYGVQYMYAIIAILSMGLVFTSTFLPVFHDLQLTSINEYLEKRYDSKIRLFGSVLYLIVTITWLPIVIYVPALAFNQVTGVNVHIVTPVVCIVCVFYTLVGGLRAVVWTDVLQTSVMVGAIIIVVIKGTIDVGGFSVVWERNWESGRIESPDWDTDPMKRHTIWSLTIGGLFYWIQSNAVNQNMLQRYLSLPTLGIAKRAFWLYLFIYLFIIIVCCYAGLLTFAKYYDCDPLKTQLARAPDQLLPLLVMDTVGNWPGLPGLFVAGVFSAALSSLSTALNSSAAVFLEDLYKPFAKTAPSERTTSILMKSSVAIIGVLSVALVIVVEKLGGVLQLSMIAGTMTFSPLLGMFSMGIFLPWVTTKGALGGGITGLCFMLWLCLRSQAAIAARELVYIVKNTTTVGCLYDFTPKNATLLHAASQMEDGFRLHHISYMWYAVLGVTVTTIAGLVFSFCTGPNDPRDLSPKLLAPVVRRFYSKRNSLSRKSLDPETLLSLTEPLKGDKNHKINLPDDENSSPIIA